MKTYLGLLAAKPPINLVVHLKIFQMQPRAAKRVGMLFFIFHTYQTNPKNTVIS